MQLARNGLVNLVSGEAEFAHGAEHTAQRRDARPLAGPGVSCCSGKASQNTGVGKLKVDTWCH
jgi:hypothetical protein